MRGFNQVRAYTEDHSSKVKKQSEYDSFERKYKENTKKNNQARLKFSTPPYCYGRKREEWMKKEDTMKYSQNVSNSQASMSEENETNSFGMK